jgi:multicomponent Na+:H+ antiporter subunit E
MLALFFLVWVVFNGRLTLEIAVFGIAVAGAVFAFVCRFMDYSFRKEMRLYKMLPVFLRYLCCLVKEIFAANITVSRLLLNRKERMEPVLVRVRTDLKTEFAKVILANSITLTPGTITVSMTEQELLVHCLDKSLSDGMEDSVFVRLLEKMEEEAV